jgi:hypothetical protein
MWRLKTMDQLALKISRKNTLNHKEMQLKEIQLKGTPIKGIQMLILQVTADPITCFRIITKIIMVALFQAVNLRHKIKEQARIKQLTCSNLTTLA